MPTILVIGATGQLGSGAVDFLLEKGFSVRAYTRSAISIASKSLTARGVAVYEGTFADTNALVNASKGCDGVFIVIPNSMDELKDAQAVLSAARTAAVPQIVYASITMADWTDHLQGEERDAFLPPGGFQSHYWAVKSAIEQEVRTAGFPRWTILRPGMFMSTMLNAPGGIFFPTPVEGEDYAAIKTAINPDKVRIGFVHQGDVGKVAAEAFLAPEHWNERVVDVCVENVTFRRIVDVMAQKGGRKVVFTEWTEEELATRGVGNPLLETQVVWNKQPIVADLSQLQKEGITLRTFEQFLDERVDDLKKTLGMA